MLLHLGSNWKEVEDLNFSVPHGGENMDMTPIFMYIKKSYLVS